MMAAMETGDPLLSTLLWVVTVDCEMRGCNTHMKKNTPI